MIAQSQNQALLVSAEKSSLNPLWSNYSEYCQLREKGLRRQSFEKLNIFIERFRSFTFEQKTEFAIFIYELAENIEDADYGPLPHQLAIELREVLIAYTEKESNDSRPFRWLAKFFNEYHYINKALDINPLDDKARVFLIDRLSYGISYSTHHLPDYYIGEPEQDLQQANLAKQHIARLTDCEEKHYWNQEIETELELVKSYSDWKNSDSSLDFKSWAKQNQRKFDSGISAYYYDK
jgi:hypothetical protein